MEIKSTTGKINKELINQLGKMFSQWVTVTELKTDSYAVLIGENLQYGNKKQVFKMFLDIAEMVGRDRLTKAFYKFTDGFKGEHWEIKFTLHFDK